MNNAAKRPWYSNDVTGFSLLHFRLSQRCAICLNIISVYWFLSGLLQRLKLCISIREIYFYPWYVSAISVLHGRCVYTWPLSKALFHTCFIFRQRCKWWSHRSNWLCQWLQTLNLLHFTLRHIGCTHFWPAFLTKISRNHSCCLRWCHAT